MGGYLLIGPLAGEASDGLGPIVLAGVYCDDRAERLLECGISDAELLAECTHHTDLELQCSGHGMQCNFVTSMSRVDIVSPCSITV